MSWLSNVIKNKKIQIAAILTTSLVLGATFVYRSQYAVLPDSVIYFLNDVQVPSQNQKVLVFSPHPDDETLGCGGYIEKSIASGANVKIVLVTDGNKHGLKEKRYDEFKKVTDSLGVSTQNLMFLNYADGKLKEENQQRLKEQFQSIIKDYNPNYILSPNESDTHPDHADTGRIIDEIMPDLPQTVIDYQYLIHSNLYPQPKKFRPSAYLLPPEKLVKFDQEWQRLMLAPDEESKKEKAISYYKSQLANPVLKPLMLSFIRKNELFTSMRGGQ